MSRWAEIEAEVPEFAAAVRALFDSRKHKVLATLRKDGSPRLTGIEVTFSDGDVWIGSMKGSRKSADLARDSRLAIQVTSPDPEDPAAWPGDARLSGRAELVDDPEQSSAEPSEEVPGVLYRIDITEAVLSKLGGDPPDRMVIESWVAGRGYRRAERF